MTEKVTTDTILDTMKEWVETKTPVAPSTWVDAALKLNVLMDEETDLLFDLESVVAKNKAYEMDNDEYSKTAAHADTIVRASKEYKEYRKQQARVKRIEEFIRIAKKQATLRDNEMSGY